MCCQGKHIPSKRGGSWRVWPPVWQSLEFERLRVRFGGVPHSEMPSIKIIQPRTSASRHHAFVFTWSDTRNHSMVMTTTRPAYSHHSLVGMASKRTQARIAGRPFPGLQTARLAHLQNPLTRTPLALTLPRRFHRAGQPSDRKRQSLNCALPRIKAHRGNEAVVVISDRKSTRRNKLHHASGLDRPAAG
jgi:hypothetical protein